MAVIDKVRQEATSLLEKVSNDYPDKVVFSTSFSLEDQVITDLIFRNDFPIKVFTLDTGRLFEETYKVWSATLRRYPGKKIEAYFPDTDELRELLTEEGPNSFYASVEQRVYCCEVRKVHPLRKALYGEKCWLTGIRKEHSPDREHMHMSEWDSHYQLYKYHPLLLWSKQQVRDYIIEYSLPYNLLYDRGYTSIGCSSCTRAVKDGEDMRAGRWWWETDNKKECGLHFK